MTLLIELFSNLDCEFLLWGKSEHQLPTAMDNTVLIEAIESLLALLANTDQTRISEDRQVVRDCWLRNVRLFYNLVH